MSFIKDMIRQMFSSDVEPEDRFNVFISTWVLVTFLFMYFAIIGFVIIVLVK